MDNSVSLTFDWFRNSDGNREILRRNVEWHYHYFSPAGCFRTSLDELKGFLKDAGETLVTSGLTDTHFSWAYVFDDLTLFPQLQEFFLKSCPGQTVVGFELSRGQKALLETAGKTYVDLRIHPVRFLPDYMFAASTNSRVIHDRLSALAPCRTYVDRHVAFCKARAARRYTKRTNTAQSVIFFAQTAIDSSRIRNREVVGDLFIVSKLERIIDEFQPRSFFVKHHPHEKMFPDMMGALKKLKAKETKTNTYDLLSTDGLVLASLSSSVCHEAQYFDTNPHMFLEPIETFSMIGEEPRLGEYVMLPSNLNTPEIWRFILGDGPRPDPIYPEPLSPYKTASGLSWG